MRSFHSERPAIAETPAKLLHPMQSKRPRGARFRSQRVVNLDDRLRSNLANWARFVDGGIIFASGLVAHATIHPDTPLPVDSLFLIAFLTILVVNLFHAARVYHPTGALEGTRSIIVMLALFAASVAVVPAVAAELTAWTAVSTAWLVRWGSLGVVALPAARVGLRAVAWWMGRDRRFCRRFLVVGDAEATQEVVEFLNSRGGGRNLVVGIVSDRPTPGVKRCRLDDLDAVMRGSRVDDVVVVLPWHDVRRIAAVTAKLRQFPVDVHLYPDRHNPVMSSYGIGLLSGVPVLQLSARPLGGWRAVTKAAEDKLLGGLAFLLALPLMAAIAVAIRLESPGPAIYRQKRYGYNNEVFTVFKFRTMVVGADLGGVVQARRDDPRVTRLGRLLRRTSLDELPQIFNVLNGTMSLVGPRPHAVEHQNYYQHLVDEYRCRHRMKPGITGWAQVNGFRGETKDLELMRKRVEHDLYYIENWSVFLDLWILVLTPIVCLWGKNAY